MYPAANKWPKWNDIGRNDSKCQYTSSHYSLKSISIYIWRNLQTGHQWMLQFQLRFNKFISCQTWPHYWVLVCETHQSHLWINNLHNNLCLQQGICKLRILQQHVPSLVGIVLNTHLKWCKHSYTANADNVMLNATMSNQMIAPSGS